jgi:hypothetical protein
MLIAEASILIRRPPETILEWIADLDRYRHADTKITRVLRQHDDRVVFRGRLRGIPTPADENIIEHVAGHSLTFLGAPRWTGQVLDFRGSFHCEITDGGTLVTHREELMFKPRVLDRLATRWLHTWMASDIVEEMARLRHLIETAPEPIP